MPPEHNVGLFKIIEIPNGITALQITIKYNNKIKPRLNKGRLISQNGIQEKSSLDASEILPIS